MLGTGNPVRHRGRPTVGVMTDRPAQGLALPSSPNFYEAEMRTEDLFKVLNINYVTEGYKHCRPGWINMECPFCTGNPGAHLGFSLEQEYFHCWRCGGRPLIETLSRLSGLPTGQIRQLLRQYGGRSRISTSSLKVIPRMKAFRFPSGCGPLLTPHSQYLCSRGFDPQKIKYEWQLQGTGPIALLDGQDYKLRIIAPIQWNNKIVSFQGRAISSTAEAKYKACPKNRELIHHKHILYGKQEKWGDTGICVEGITDVWRLGPKAFAVFGINYLQQQVKEIVRHFARVAVVFDDDPQATKQANKLIAELRMRGIEAWRIDIEEDPGGMSEDDARHLVREIIS